MSNQHWLGTLQQRYADRLLPVTAEVAEEWGRINVPDPLPTVDGLLAATARIHDLVLVTRNTADVAPASPGSLVQATVSKLGAGSATPRRALPRR